MPESIPLIVWGRNPGRCRSVKRRDTMVAAPNPKSQSADPESAGPQAVTPETAESRSSGATRRTAVGLILGAPLLGACAGVQQSLNQFSSPFSSSSPGPAPGPAGPPQQSEAVGNGQVKVGLLL